MTFSHPSLHPSLHPPRILILKPSSLGDIIHTLPTLAALRRRYPTAHISWLINTTFASILRDHPLLNEIIPFDRHHYGRPGNLPAFADFLATLQGRQFDIALDLQGLFRTGLMAWATLAPRRLGLSDSRECAGLFHTEIIQVPHCHAVDRYLLVARHLDCPPGPVEFPLGLDERAPARSLIAINPLSRWEPKNWGDDNFSALLDQLPAARVVLIGSAAEHDRIETINRGRARNLAGKLDLLQLADLYRQCVLVITNDTGPMHLAAAVGAPVLALFGPTDPALVGPYGPGHTVLRSPTGDIRAITLDQVLRQPVVQMLAEGRGAVRP
jgi:lipopolysaccharide heptosyltransferase I